MKIILTILVLITSLSTVYAKKKGKENLDSLMKELPKAKEDTSKVKLLLRIAWAHRSTDSKTALIYAKKSEAMAAKLNFKEGLSKSRYFIGNVYLEISDYHNALKYYNKSLEFERVYGDNESIASVLHNIANAYLSLGNYPKGIEVNLQALKLFEKAGSKNGTANCHNNIGIIYNDIGDEKSSVYHFRKALKLYTEIDSKPGIAVSLNNMANYYMSMNDLLKSKEVITKALFIYEELDDAEGKDLALINLSQNSLLGRDYDNALIFGFRALQIAKDFDMPEAIAYDYESIGAIYYEMAMDENLKSAKANAFVSKNIALKLADAYVDSSIAIFSNLEMLTEYSKAAELKAKISFASGDYKQAFINYKLFKILNDSIFNIEKDKKITQSAMQYDFDKKEAKINAENEKRSIRQRNIRNSITGGLIGTLIFLVVVYRQRNKISKEKTRSEELLLNILPSEVAEELKEKGSADAKNFDEVTVLFTDFKGFTQLSEKLSPKELVAEINHCFSAFDYIMQKHGIEKIKTIGDAYMAAGGIPTPNKSHPVDVVNAALDIQQFMNNLKAQKEAEGKHFFEIRIGIHTGTVVAGIVGVKKFAYDIWGDTVNTASRMESSGEVGKVNISGTTYELIKDKFNCVHRGKVQAKNKGELDMYYVEGRI